MRIQVIPGARMLWIVTMKLIAPMIEEIEVRWIARIQRSWPLPGSKSFSDSGGDEDQPARGAPPAADPPLESTNPPSRERQEERAVKRGKGPWRAPRLSG